MRRPDGSFELPAVGFSTPWPRGNYV